MPKRLLIVQAAALGYDFCRGDDSGVGGLELHSAQSVFPAVTCSVQASFRTASLPAAHGVVGNGRFWRDLRKVMFWEQSAALVGGERIWADFRRRGGRVGMLFWQQSLGEDADVLLSPAPIHKHHGGMIQDCYARPSDLYARLRAELGGFKLRHYWGPMASSKAGDWIAAATVAVLGDPHVAPDLCLTYLPTLDYDLQRFGPDDARSRGAGRALRRQLGQLIDAARERDYDVLVFGDYAIEPTDRAVFPNRALREASLLSVRSVRGMLYPDFHTSRAFAVADHQIAHVYVRDDADLPEVREVLAALDGVADVFDRGGQADHGIDHPHSGELVIVARAGAWLAYPWWRQRKSAPDYASHVDIHNKPGYDPCELLFGWPPMSVSQDPRRVRGSHGRTGPGRQVAWATSLELQDDPANLIDLAEAVRNWLNRPASPAGGWR